VKGTKMTDRDTDVTRREFLLTAGAAAMAGANALAAAPGAARRKPTDKKIRMGIVAMA